MDQLPTSTGEPVFLAIHKYDVFQNVHSLQLNQLIFRPIFWGQNHS